MVNGLLFALELAGFLAAFLTFIGLLHLLFVAQIVTSLAFGLLVIRTAKHLAEV